MEIIIKEIKSKLRPGVQMVYETIINDDLWEITHYKPNANYHLKGKYVIFCENSYFAKRLPNVFNSLDSIKDWLSDFYGKENNGI